MLSSSDRSAISVLIIEDSEIVRAMIARLLQNDDRIGSVHGAASAAEARHFLADHAVDVATLDLTLPDGHGAGLVETIRAAGQCGVIVVSGSPSEHARAIELGATAAIDKARLIDNRRLLIDSVHRAAAQSRAMAPPVMRADVRSSLPRRASSAAARC